MRFEPVSQIHSPHSVYTALTIAPGFDFPGIPVPYLIIASTIPIIDSIGNPSPNPWTPIIPHVMSVVSYPSNDTVDREFIPDQSFRYLQHDYT